MKKELDELLKQALTPTDEPDFWLNQRILNQAKETNRMNMKKARRIPAAAIAAAVVLGAGSVSAYAAWKYMAPEKMAENVKDYALMKAFQGEDAVTVDERQSYGGYDVTLLGIVSGKNITQYRRESNGQVVEDQTYVAVAIENSDGTPMPKTSDDAYADLSFCVSPLIKGYDPNRYNVFTMRGGYSEFEEDGILYRLVECDNVEIFADHGLYLCVSDGTFYNQEAYQYDEATGEITRNDGYEGLNALFSLPIDVSKADPQAAAEYLTSLEDDEQEDDADDSKELSSEDAKAEEWMQNLTPENIEEYAQRVESTVQNLTPDEDGYADYQYDLGDDGSGSGSICVDDYFPDGKAGMSKFFGFSHSEGMEGMTVTTFTLQDDGKVLFAVYVPKETQSE